MGKFDAGFYREFRPFYPADAFGGLAKELGTRGFLVPFQVADIGCGTGHSSVSLLRAGIDARIEAVDPDPGMLQEAFRLAQSEGVLDRIRFRSGSGEESGLAAAGFDAILVGSAFHWMNAERAREEFARILKPGGVLWIFEYQFPKALQAPELNEWVRRQFNLHWKAPGQTPRGTLAELTRPFREDPRFELLGERKPAMVLELGPEQLAGLIFSQSRYLHFERPLRAEARSAARAGVQEKLSELMKGTSHLKFDFRLAVQAFARTR